MEFPLEPLLPPLLLPPEGGGHSCVNDFDCSNELQSRFSRHSTCDSTGELLQTAPEHSLAASPVAEHAVSFFVQRDWQSALLTGVELPPDEELVEEVLELQAKSAARKTAEITRAGRCMQQYWGSGRYPSPESPSTSDLTQVASKLVTCVRNA